MSHSKRNTSLAFFTAHERSQLRSSWGSQSQRLTRDSFLPFGSCALCLLPAQDPVACTGGPKRADNRAANAKGATPDSRKRKREDDDQGTLECHMFCRECAMSNLLAQRKELKRLERLGDVERAEQREDDAREDDEARARAVQEFEAVQMGLDVRAPTTTTTARDAGSREDTVSMPRALLTSSAANTNGNSDGAANGAGATKDEEGDDKKQRRAFDLNEDELLRVAREDRQNARATLSDEKAAKAKSALPSFWVPSLTPSEGKTAPGVTAATGALAGSSKKATPVCPGSTAETAHALSLKSLVTVRLTTESERRGEDAESGERVEGATKLCPACSRPLTNASRATLAKPCGHVVCGSCVARFIRGDEGDVVTSSAEMGKKKELRCFVCTEPLVERKSKERKAEEKHKAKEKDSIKPGLVEISSEGTGFASGGKAVVKVAGTAFQC